MVSLESVVFAGEDFITRLLPSDFTICPLLFDFEMALLCFAIRLSFLKLSAKVYDKLSEISSSPHSILPTK